ncbi:MAG: hypothetical protein WCE69_17745 [Aestuariivirga sp.]
MAPEATYVLPRFKTFKKFAKTTAHIFDGHIDAFLAQDSQEIGIPLDCMIGANGADRGKL